MRKHYHTKIAALLTAAFLAACSGQTTEKTEQTAPQAEAKIPHVAITAIVEHPALDDVRHGLLAELSDAGLKDGENLHVNFQSAQGNTATAGQIAKQFVGDQPDVIVAIATPSAQSVVAATNTIPVVFAAVTDPVEAKLVPSWNASKTNVTGVSDLLPLDRQITLMKEIIPNLKRVGYVYSPSEVNSTVVLKELEEKLKTEGIEVVPAPAQRTTDIPMATRGLQGKVDVIYTSLDNNVVSAYESMYQAAKESKIPLIASDTGSVARGAVAALGVNYYDMGKQAGKVVLRILDGEKVGDIKPATMETLDLHISPKHAEEEGISLPESVIQAANKNVDEATDSKQ